MKQERIVLVGGGAIGLSLVAHLAPCTLLVRTAEQARRLGEQGLQFKINGNKDQALGLLDVRVFNEWEHFSDCSLLVVATKQDALTEQVGLQRWISRQAKHYGSNVIPLQNGAGHIERLSTLGIPLSQLWPAVATFGAFRHTLNHVELTGPGEWLLYVPEQADGALAEVLVQRLKNKPISCTVTRDELLFKQRFAIKWLTNAVINPLTAIFKVRNGQLPEQPQRLQLMRELHDESVKIIRKAGYPLTPNAEETFNIVLETCRRTATNESSMYVDVQRGRKTEIQSINGELLRLAGQLGLDARLNREVIALIERMTG